MTYAKTILHVDDDPNLTRLVAKFLGKRGYVVTSLNDPSQVHEVMRKSQFQVVLLDIDMPGYSGLDLLKEIKESNGGCQVIMLTGLVSVLTLLQSFRWGAEYCIFKPLTDLQPLQQAVEAAFRKIDHWWRALDELSKQRLTLNDVGSLNLALMEAGNALAPGLDSADGQFTL